MRLKRTCQIILLLLIGSASIQAQNRLVIEADRGKSIINRHIYGHFSEHLGRCIYGGYWVGEDSSIPNTRGIRNDVVQALKDISIPNLRWPGGCFADEYHWMDGIGPRADRPKMINTHWGGVVEDNSFGTHEFLDLCEQLNTEAYISANVGSGTVEEMSKWIEYVTFDGESPMANLRRKNGRTEPWKVKFWGIGNESWGCGGNMTPDYYSDLYRHYATFARNYGDNRLYRIACGANGGDYNWTETVMKNAARHMQGLSLHYYTVPRDWANKGSATDFDEAEYFTTIEKTLFMEELITKHGAIMDKYDPQKRVGMYYRRVGHLVQRGAGHQPGIPLSAEHTARCHRGRDQSQHLQRAQRSGTDGQPGADGECVTGCDAHRRGKDAPHPHLLGFLPLQGTSGRNPTAHLFYRKQIPPRVTGKLMRSVCLHQKIPVEKYTSPW